MTSGLARVLGFGMAIAVLCGSSGLASAEGALRDKLKERVKERLLENRDNKPDSEAPLPLTKDITGTGDYYFSIQQGSLTRQYLVHVPTRYSPQKPTPLLFAFHGGGGDMDYMARDGYYGLTSKSNKEGFVLVYPNGYSKFSSGKFATWNAGNCCGDARDKKIDDIGFVRSMVTALTSHMNIDRSKIFATGMSNGGMMAQRIACEMPDVFAAVASVAGTDNTIQCNPSRPISVMNIHARNDTHVLFNGGAGKDAFKDMSKVTEFTSVPDTINRWVQRNHCNPKPERVLSVEGAFCDLYRECNDNTLVKLCVTESGGHSWPGGNKPRGKSPSQVISANDEMWDFFMGLK